VIIADVDLRSVTAAAFADGTGWDPKPDGLCRGEVCVPAPGALRDDGTVDVDVAAGRLGMPVLHDDAHGLTVVGPGSTTGHALSAAAAADPEFVDREGNPFRLSSLRGRKVILHAWASYCGCRDGIASWQQLHEELEPLGVSVVSVALDVEPEHTYKWIDRANPTHPCVIDTRHATAELFGINNIPMAVWIDEHGTIVRNAESAAIVPSPFRNMELPDGLPERLARQLDEAKAIPDDSAAYRAAVVDWAHHGAASEFSLRPDEVVERSLPRGRAEATAAAAFELGQHLRITVGEDAAVPWWRMAHELDPGNWTYKRQAWTLVTTPPGADNDLLQGPNDVYDGNWLDDVITAGGGAKYTSRPQF
jgi:peroxiredoxin